METPMHNSNVRGPYDERRRLRLQVQILTVVGDSLRQDPSQRSERGESSEKGPHPHSNLERLDKDRKYIPLKKYSPPYKPSPLHQIGPNMFYIFFILSGCLYVALCLAVGGLFDDC